VVITTYLQFLLYYTHGVKERGGYKDGQKDNTY
jgi:hypothetical protein